MQVDLTGYSQINDRFYYNRFIRLGTGAFGTVFKGYDCEYKRFIAVKQISRSNLYGLQNGELKQISIMNKLKHKNIMDFYGYHGSKTNPEGIFMFLQLCEKGTLVNQISNKMTERRAYELFTQLVEGMAYMHSQGIFHRDLKPDNLLLTQNDELKIADFGIAKEVSSHATFKKCTPVYSAPEVYIQQIFQKNNQTYNLKCDTFSAGYILYEMLTSQQLNKGVKTAEDLRKFLVINKNQGGFKIQHPALTPRWVDLLKNMLNFDPIKRPTFKDIKHLIAKFLPAVDKLPQMRPQTNDQIKHSQGLVKKVKKFVESVNNRNNYLVNILKILSKYQQKHSSFIPRVYKVLILYLTLARYCYLSQDGIKMLSDKDHIFPNINKSLTEIEQQLTLNDKVAVSNFIKSLVSRINEGIEQMKVFVSKNIITLISKIMREDDASLEKKVIKESNIQNNLNGFKINQFETDSFYQLGTRKCVNNLYRTVAQLQILTEEDLRIYLVCLYVANIDRYFNMNNYQLSTLPPSYQQILKMDKAKLQQSISIEKNKQ